MFAPENVLLDVIRDVISGQHERLAVQKNDIWRSSIGFQIQIRDAFNFPGTMDFLK